MFFYLVVLVFLSMILLYMVMMLMLNVLRSCIKIEILTMKDLNLANFILGMEIRSVNANGKK